MGWLDAMLGWNTIPQVQVNLPPVETPVANALQGYVGIVEPSTPDLTIPHNPGNTPILDAGQASMPNTGNIPASAIPDVGQVARETQASQEATTSPWVEDTPHHGSAIGAGTDNVTYEDPLPPPSLNDEAEAISLHDSNTDSSQEGSVTPATTPYDSQTVFALEIAKVQQQAREQYSFVRNGVIDEIDYLVTTGAMSQETGSKMKEIIADIESASTIAGKASMITGAIATITNIAVTAANPDLGYDHEAFDKALAQFVTDSNKRTAFIEKLKIEGQRHKQAMSEIAKWYDPNSPDADQFKHIYKTWMAEQKTHGTTIGKIIAENVTQEPIPKEYALTPHERLNIVAKGDPDLAKVMGNLNTETTGNTFTKLNKGLKVLDKFCTVLGVTASAASLGTETIENWDAWTKLFTGEGNLKGRMSQDKWDSINCQMIDTVTGAISTVVGIFGTPLAGAATGVGLHYVGAFAKATFLKKQHEDADFWKTFWYHVGLGNTESSKFILKDGLGADDIVFDSDKFLQGYVSYSDIPNVNGDLEIPIRVPNTLLRQSLEGLTLYGEAQDGILYDGNIEYLEYDPNVLQLEIPQPNVPDVTPNDPANGQVIQSDEAYDLLVPPANACVSTLELPPDIELADDVDVVSLPDGNRANGCVSEPEVYPDLAEDVDIFKPSDDNRANDVAIATPRTIRGSELVSTEPSWSSVNEVSTISDCIYDEDLCAPPDLGTTPSALIGPSFYELPERDFAAAETMTIFASVGSIRDIGM